MPNSTNIEPQTRAFLDAVAAQGGPPLHTLSVADARKVLLGAQAKSGSVPRADIQDATLPAGPGGGVSIRIVRPPGFAGSLPVVMYFHGGGWVLGDKQTHDRLIREIAIGAQAAVVFVNYTPSPEARFPVALEEAFAATKWVAENGTSYNLDGSRLAVSGDSVGGNMAAAVTLLAKERGGPRINYQVLFYPVTDAKFETGSYQLFSDGPWLTRDAMKWFWDHYLPDVSSRGKPLASPLRAPAEQLRGLPPALVITAEFDVLRDEGEGYAHRLNAADVPVTMVRYLGTIHDFVLLNALAETPAARGALFQATMALRQALGTKSADPAKPAH